MLPNLPTISSNLDAKTHAKSIECLCTSVNQIGQIVHDFMQNIRKLLYETAYQFHTIRLRDAQVIFIFIDKELL
jgi:hypothetical protein